MATWLLACAAPKLVPGPREEILPIGGTGLPGAIFPHAAGWDDPSAHGKAMAAYGLAACLACHTTNGASSDATGLNLAAGAGIPPTCHSCHFLFPHAAGWVEKGAHGDWALESDKAECMTACHGADLAGGLSGVACTACHAIYPHPSNWAEFVGHGKVAKEQGITVCQSCHGADLRGEWYGVGCDQCHGSYPHSNTEVTPWKEFVGHGQYALLHTKTECTLCHGADYQGGPRQNPSCVSCHAPYPHPTGWRQAIGQPQGHGLYVQANTSASCATAHCHGANLTPEPGVTQGVGCNSCHQAYPHPADWKSGFVHGPVAKVNIGLCKTCHGSGLASAPPGSPTCKSCHPAYLQHASAGLEETNWATGAGHGAYVMAPPNSGNKAECQLCHGADFAGGIANRSCFTCHAEYPHTAATWATAPSPLHAAKVAEKTAAKTLSDCTQCHNLTGTTPPAAAPTCTTCHDPGDRYPHAAGWYQASDPFGGGHGPAVAATIDPTQPGPASQQGAEKAGCLTACHGKAGAGGFIGAEKYCTTCHATYPHLAANWLERQLTAEEALLKAAQEALAPTSQPQSTNSWEVLKHLNVPPYPTLPDHAIAVLSFLPWVKPPCTAKDPSYKTVCWDSYTKAPRYYDYFSKDKFAACAKCHGEELVFEYNQPRWEWPAQNLYVLKDGAPHLKRCTACHNYPHVYVQQTSSKPQWQGGHPGVVKQWCYKSPDWAGMPVSEIWKACSTDWKAEPQATKLRDFTVKQCFGTSSGLGCHTDGKWPVMTNIYTQGALCIVCHSPLAAQ
ncbi:MAG: hypothetical protein HYV03_02365 [Deltaproteobacteria bacterium]|nr:hypothetical protein [Deltaproteobacteria bacterium]